MLKQRPNGINRPLHLMTKELRMPNAYIYVGLPGCGKTTHAMNVVQSKPDTMIICPDTIRTMLYGRYAFYRQDEDMIKGISFDALNRALRYGRDAILDESTYTLTIEQRKNLVWYLQASLGRYIKKLKIIAVIFPVIDGLKNRLADSRGLPREHWESVYQQMTEVYQPMTDKEEFSELIIVDKF